MPKKEAKLNDFKPEELEALKSETKTLQEQVGALTELLAYLEGRVKKVEEKSYPGDIANAIREGFGGLAQRPVAAPTYVPPPAPYVPPPAPVAHVATAPVGGFQFDIFSVGWIQKNKQPAPPNPTWGWAFAYTQDGGRHAATAPLVQYLEQHGVYHVGDHIVKLGGTGNKLLQLSKKRT